MCSYGGRVKTTEIRSSDCQVISRLNFVGPTSLRMPGARIMLDSGVLVSGLFNRTPYRNRHHASSPSYLLCTNPKSTITLAVCIDEDAKILDIVLL